MRGASHGGARWGRRVSKDPHAATRRSSSRRDELFDAALDSVAQHGFERASLRDIASRAGMSHVGLLRHFNSKEELLAAALNHEDDRTAAEIRPLLTAGLSDSEVMQAVMQIALRDRDRTRRWLSLTLGAVDPTHPAHAWFSGRYDRLVAMVEDYASRAHRRSDGRFDPRTRALLMLSMLDGLRL